MKTTFFRLFLFSLGIAVVSSCENDEGDDKKIDKKNSHSFK